MVDNYIMDVTDVNVECQNKTGVYLNFIVAVVVSIKEVRLKERKKP